MSESRAFFGTVAMGAVNAGKLGLQLAVLPIMARLLGPSAFGLIAVAMPFILMANLLCDGGMGAALARHRKPSPELESTVFWLSLAISVTLAWNMISAWQVWRSSAQLVAFRKKLTTERESDVAA